MGQPNEASESNLKKVQRLNPEMALSLEARIDLFRTDMQTASEHYGVFLDIEEVPLIDKRGVLMGMTMTVDTLPLEYKVEKG